MATCEQQEKQAAGAVAQLRHLYQQMMDGQVKDTAEAARGLLGPAIERLESASLSTPTPEDVEDDVIVLERWLRDGMDLRNQRYDALARLRAGAARAKVLESDLKQARRGLREVLEEHNAGPVDDDTDSLVEGAVEVTKKGRERQLDAESDLAAARQEVETLKRYDLHNMTGRAEAAERALVDLRARVATLERERAVSVEMLHARGQQIDELNARAESAEARVREMEEQAEAAEATLEDEQAAHAETLAREAETRERLEAALNLVQQVARQDRASLCWCPEGLPDDGHHIASCKALRQMVTGKAPVPTPPAPAPLVEAASLVNPENILGPSLCRRLRKADMKQQQYTLDAQEVMCVVRLLTALHERLAAHDTARAGSPPPAVVEAVVTTVRQALYQHGLSASLANEAARVVRESLAAHDAAKGGEDVAEKARKWDAAVVRLEYERKAKAERSHWDYAHVILTGDVPPSTPSPGGGEPVITHAALAALVDAKCQEWEAKRMAGHLDGQTATARSNAAKAVLAAVRATGGQVPEVLPKARVEEQLRALMGANGLMDALDKVPDASGVLPDMPFNRWDGVVAWFGKYLGLTLDTPPSGQHGEPTMSPQESAAYVAKAKALRTPGAKWRCDRCLNPEGECPWCVPDDTPPSGPGGGVAGDLCPCERAGVDNCGGPCLLPAGQTMATATHHGGPVGEPREAPVAPTPEGPALAWADLSSQPRPAPHSTCHQDECQEGEPQTCPAFGQREPEPAACEVVWEGEGVRVLRSHDSLPGEYVVNIPPRIGMGGVIDVLARALAESKREHLEDTDLACRMVVQVAYESWKLGAEAQRKACADAVLSGPVDEQETRGAVHQRVLAVPLVGEST